MFLVSTPTIQGLSRIEREYEASDQRRFFVPCPHCGALQWLRFERLRWEKGKPETAHYHLRGLRRRDRGASQDGDARGRRVAGDRATASDPTARSASTSRRSIRRWAGCPGSEIAREWEAAQATDEAKRSFKNSVLGETWVETGEAPDWQRLYERREDWQIGTVPTRRAVPDRRRRRSEGPDRGRVWAWGRGLESWLVDHVVIEGGPERAESWDQL